MSHRNLFLKASSLGAALAIAGTISVQAGELVGEFPPETFLVFDTTLESLNLTGGPYPIPVGSDPGNALFPDAGGGVAADGGLASVEGYAFVDSLVTITLSSQRPSTGLPAGVPPGPGPSTAGVAVAVPGNLGEQAFGLARRLGELGPPPTIDPAELDGQQFFVDSFFDVFFDITVTDIDTRPGRDFAGQAHGATILLPDNGPAGMEAFYFATFDADAPNFGLIPPPEVSPYIGHFEIEIPLGGDINGNGINDKIKFTIASHAAGDENRVFTTLPNGTVIDEFDSAAFLAGAVVDESTDPPFTLGTGSPSAPGFGAGGLTGPTTATSTLLNPVAGLNAPDSSSTIVLLATSLFGLLGFAGAKKRRAAKN